MVCPTPIGNLADVTLRTLEWLREADVIACEDTRRTRLLLERHGAARGPGAVISFHEHNEAARTRELLDRIQAGASVALLSDAGMPLLADPGYQLLRGCIDAGLPITVLPGPSAITTALVASGLPPAEFRFVGFLPRRPAELTRLLEANGETLIGFESPRRLSATLTLLASIDVERPVAVCRELSKLHEEVVRGSATELAELYAHRPARGEVTLVIGAAPVRSDGDPRALAAVQELIEAGARPRLAAGVVARLTGARANELYRALSRERPRDGQ